MSFEVKKMASFERKGLLLVETLVSFFVFTIAVFSLYGLLGASRTADTRARVMVAATHLADELIETIEATEGDLTPGRSQGERSLVMRRGGQPSRIDLSYEVSVTPGPEPGLFSVLVTVTPQGSPGKVEMEQYVRR